MSDKTVIRHHAPIRVGKYLLRGKLGEGAMGVVYDAHDPDIDRPVAIKTVHRHLIEAAGAEDWLERFPREAKAAGRVLHPNLVTIFDFLVHDGLPYLVMERLEASSTLEDRLADPRGLPLEDVRDIVVQMLDGLDAIHEVGIVHRDMKPANVMLASAGRLKLTDFGIARITSAERTGAGMIGTPAYMSPEQFSGGDVDARADIYAVGVVLYEILTGKLPFQKGGIEAVMMAGKGQAPAAPSAWVPDLPSALDDVVLRALSADPAGRFASAAEMKAAFETSLAGTPGSDVTLVARTKAPRPAAGTMISRLSGAAMSGLEQSLVARIGPMGRILARRAAQSASSQDALMEQILSEVSEGSEREDLRRAIARHLSSNTGRTGTPAITQADLAHIIAALTPHLGPIAGTMVRRHASSASSAEDLLETLADTLPDAAERADFLSRVKHRHP
ncbi:protein kinase domain-containing protein [Thalassobius sp. S69A]|uniref:serine/threonine-protein kinase n=1 Tax=unclassified Thalassovita TaxID=2619711 RepID=UPI003C7DE342